MNRYRKFVVPLLVLILLSSFTANLFFLYKISQENANHILLLAGAKAEYTKGNGEGVLRYAYGAFSDEYVGSSFAQIIGDVYYCKGDAGAAVMNYDISGYLSASNGFKALMRENIDAIGSGKNSRGLPNCEKFHPSNAGNGIAALTASPK